MKASGEIVQGTHGEIFNNFFERKMEEFLEKIPECFFEEYSEGIQKDRLKLQSEKTPDGITKNFFFKKPCWNSWESPRRNSRRNLRRILCRNLRRWKEEEEEILDGTPGRIRVGSPGGTCKVTTRRILDEGSSRKNSRNSLRRATSIFWKNFRRHRRNKNLQKKAFQEHQAALENIEEEETVE